METQNLIQFIDFKRGFKRHLHQNECTLRYKRNNHPSYCLLFSREFSSKIYDKYLKFGLIGTKICFQITENDGLKVTITGGGKSKNATINNRDLAEYLLRSIEGIQGKIIANDYKQTLKISLLTDDIYILEKK